MIHLDTNFLIQALIAGSPADARLVELLASGETAVISAVVWAEFLCGPVSAEAIAIAARLFPSPLPLQKPEAELAAEMFNGTGRRRGSLSDCMIAATAVCARARLATENLTDFKRFEPYGLQVL